MRLKSRKRNIVIPHDPQSFADAVIEIIGECSESEDIEQTLDAATKALDSAELDFNRYGDTLFEVIFAGARLSSGGVAAEGKSLPFNILACPADRTAIIPFIKWFQSLIRRKPFLVKALEDTIIKFILSLEFYDAEQRKKIAIAMARCFSLKVGVLPDRILPAALEDRLVARGTIATFITDFFADYLATDSVEGLIDLLRKSRLQDRMLEFFPQQKQNWNDFEDHFKAAGLSDFVEYYKRKLYDTHCQDLKDIVKDAVATDPPIPVTDVIATIKGKKEENQLADADVVKFVYLGIVGGVLDSSSGKNTQQVHFSVLKTLKAYHKALLAVCTSARLEATLMVTIQVTCYEDSRLLKLFADIIKIMYDVDVLGEDTIRFWYTKGSNPKGRNVFTKDLEPLIEWLDEAEEEEDDEE